MGDMLDELRRVLEGNPDIAYALLFGSGARGALSPTSDVDVAVELRRGAPHDTAALGQLATRLESATGRRVDLVLMDEAAAPLAYRLFRDGRVILERGQAALVARQAQALPEEPGFQARTEERRVMEA